MAQTQSSKWIPPLKVIPQQFETAHGIMLRLCERNGLGSMNSLEHATGLKMGHIFAGRHLTGLATILNKPEEELQALAFQVQAGKPTLVKGQELRKFDIDRKKRRVCIQCLQQNSYQQFWWDLNFITHCPFHSIELVGSCPCGQPLSWRDREICRCRRCRSESVLDMTPAPVLSGRHFETWALSKFGVGPKVALVPILDSLLMKDAIALVTRVGRLERTGWAKYWIDSETNLDELHEYSEIGFEIINNDGLLSLFDRVHKQSEALHESPPTTMEGSLGWFWTWFAHVGASKLSSELAQQVARHFDNRFMIKQPVTSLGSQTGPRSLLGLTELSARTGTAPSILREVLLSRGLMPSSVQGKSFVISPDVAEWVEETMGDTMEIRQAQQFVGVGWRVWETLLNRNWLPVHMPSVTYSSRSSKSIPFIRKKDLEDWIEGLAGEAATLSECPDGHSTVSGDNRNKNVNFEKLFERVIDGKVPIVGRLSYVSGLASLVVKNDDIDDLVFRGGGRYCNRQIA